VVGKPLGSPTFVQNALLGKLNGEYGVIEHALRCHPQKQNAPILLWLCCSRMPHYFFRVLDQTETQAFAKAKDASYLRILASFMEVTVSKLDPEHLVSAMELGGLGIQACELVHDLAYLSPWIAVSKLPQTAQYQCLYSLLTADLTADLTPRTTSWALSVSENRLCETMETLWTE